MEKGGWKAQRDGTRTWDPCAGHLECRSFWWRAVLPKEDRPSRGEVFQGYVFHLSAWAHTPPWGLSEAQHPTVFRWVPGESCALCISGSTDLAWTLTHRIAPAAQPLRETPKCAESRAQKCFRRCCCGSPTMARQQPLHGSLGTSEDVGRRCAAAARPRRV